MYIRVFICILLFFGIHKFTFNTVMHGGGKISGQAN